jgi:hypothetical protein
MAQIVRKKSVQWSYKIWGDCTTSVCRPLASTPGDCFFSQDRGIVPSSKNMDLKKSVLPRSTSHYNVRGTMKVQNSKGLHRITAKDDALGIETFPATLTQFTTLRSGSCKLEHSRGFITLDHGLNVLKDDVDNQSLEFIENRKAMDELLLDLQKKVEKVRERGSIDLMRVPNMNSSFCVRSKSRLKLPSIQLKFWSKVGCFACKTFRV